MYENGDKYEGEWIDSFKDGKGIYTYNNGDVYEGEFKKGKKKGEGKYIFKDGTKVFGIFDEDQLVKKIEKNDEEKELHTEN